MNQTQKKNRNKWTRKEYKDVMYCFYFTLENLILNNTDRNLNKWRECNSNRKKLVYLDANMLANTELTDT